MGKTWRAGGYDSSGYEKVTQRRFYGFSVFRRISALQYGQVAAELIKIQQRCNYKGLTIRGHDLEAGPAMQIVGMYETVRVPELKKTSRGVLTSIIQEALADTVQKPKPAVLGVDTFSRGGRHISIAARLCPDGSNFVQDRASLLECISGVALGHEVNVPEVQSLLTLVRVGHRASDAIIEDIVGEVSQVIPKEIHLQPPTVHIPDVQLS